MCICIAGRSEKRGEERRKERREERREERTANTKDRKLAKEHYTGPQRIGNHERTARLATLLCGESVRH